MPRTTGEELCRCGHGHVAHQHYRRGTDCAHCTCARYVVAAATQTGLGARVLRRVLGLSA